MYMLNEDKVNLNRLLKIKFICNVLFWALVPISVLSLIALVITNGNNLFIEWFTITTIGVMVINEIISLFLSNKLMQYNELINKESNIDD